MNQEKIGKFISECRKKKGLTQLQLAEKLSITNRAVSKWETGKSCPDASIMMELCDILGITVNDLLSGEMITMENYQKYAEDNLVELCQKKEKAAKDLFKFELIFIAISILLVPIHFSINYYYPENNGTGIGMLLSIIAVAFLIIYFFTHYEIRLK